MKVVIGKQDFASLREHDYFYIDKTGLIEAWWEAGDDVTLITRPRRFGKTLNMSMLNCFFSNRYSGRADLFDGLNIWNNEKYRQLQGTRRQRQMCIRDSLKLCRRESGQFTGFQNAD